MTIEKSNNPDISFVRGLEDVVNSEYKLKFAGSRNPLEVFEDNPIKGYAFRNRNIIEIILRSNDEEYKVSSTSDSSFGPLEKARGAPIVMQPSDGDDDSEVVGLLEFKDGQCYPVFFEIYTFTLPAAKKEIKSLPSEGSDPDVSGGIDCKDSPDHSKGTYVGDSSASDNTEEATAIEDTKKSQTPYLNEKKHLVDGQQTDQEEKQPISDTVDQVKVSYEESGKKNYVKGKQVATYEALKATDDVTTKAVEELQENNTRDSVDLTQQGTSMVPASVSLQGTSNVLLKTDFQCIKSYRLAEARNTYRLFLEIGQLLDTKKPLGNDYRALVAEFVEEYTRRQRLSSTEELINHISSYATLGKLYEAVSCIEKRDDVVDVMNKYFKAQCKCTNCSTLQ